MSMTALFLKLLEFFTQKKVVSYDADNESGTLRMDVADGNKIIHVWVSTREKQEEKGEENVLLP